MVRNIQLKHSGKYVCMVHTKVDTVSAAAELTVRGEQPVVIFITVTLLYARTENKQRPSLLMVQTGVSELHALSHL